MISVATYDKGRSVAPEIVSETILEAFKIVVHEDNWSSTCVFLIDEWVTKQFMLHAEHIITPTKRVKKKTVTELMSVLKNIFFAIEDDENLYQFSAFEEFLINEILEMAVRRIKDEDIRWIVPGTYISRQRLLKESVKRAEELNFIFGEDYDTIEYGQSIALTLLDPAALVRDEDGFMIFNHIDDAITSWDPAKVTIPQFEVAVKSVEQAESESLMDVVESPDKDRKSQKSRYRLMQVLDGTDGMIKTDDLEQ